MKFGCSNFLLNFAFNFRNKKSNRIIIQIVIFVFLISVSNTFACNMSGCTNCILADICLSCQSSQHFKLNQKVMKCQCDQSLGFIIDSNNLCVCQDKYSFDPDIDCCVYQQVIKTSLKRYYKDPNKNKLLLTFKLSQFPEKYLNISTLQQIISFSFQTQKVYISLHSGNPINSKFVNVQILYNQLLQSNIRIFFNFTKLKTLSNSQIQYFTLPQVSDNGINLMASQIISQTELNRIRVGYAILTYLFIFFSIVLCFLGLTFYAVQTMITLQRIYFLQFNLGIVSLSFNCLTQLWISTGFNINDMHSLQQQISQSIISNDSPRRVIKYIGFSFDIFDNFNLNLAMILLLFILAGAFYWLSIYYRQKKLYRLSEKCYTSWMMYWILFISIPTSVSGWITFIYSQNLASAKGVFQIFIILMFLGIYWFIFYLMFSEINPTIQIQSQQKEHSSTKKFSCVRLKRIILNQFINQKRSGQKHEKNFQKQYSIILIYFQLYSLLVGCFSFSVVTNFLIILLQIIHFIYILKVKLYKNMLRPIANSFIVMIFQFFFLIQRLTQTSDFKTRMQNQRVQFLLGLLYIVLIINIIVIALQIIKSKGHHIQSIQIINANFKDENKLIKDIETEQNLEQLKQENLKNSQQKLQKHCNFVKEIQIQDLT